MDDSTDNKYLYDRRFVPKRNYEVKSLWENHHSMLRMLALGHSNADIAEAHGVTAQTISNLRNSPVAKTKLHSLRETLDSEAIDIGARINEFAPLALKLLEDVISGEVEAPIAIRAKYASVHLGRAGFGEVKKIASVNTHLTRDDIELIKMRAIDSAREAGLIVED
jgi:DNA-binding CsgD family transcriptional regulator